jgi:hypothetical protein
MNVDSNIDEPTKLKKGLELAIRSTNTYIDALVAAFPDPYDQLPITSLQPGRVRREPFSGLRVRMAQEEPNPADDHASPSDRSPTIALAPTLSKSAQKKAIKAERYAALKLERRAREKEAKKQKKRLLAEKRAAADGGDDDERDVLLDSERASRRKRSRVDGNSFGARIVVDLGFDDKMTDKVCVMRTFKRPCRIQTF